MPIRHTDDCPVCAPEGHSARRHGARMRRASRFESAPVGPIAVEPGDAFIVVEDVPDEQLYVDAVWRATKPTGRVVGGYAEWWLLFAKPGGGRRRGFPQLYPFFKTARRARPDANVTTRSAETTPDAQKGIAS